MMDWFLFLFIHAVVPIIGIVAFVLLIRKMKLEQIQKPPKIQLFWVFGIYGLMLILGMTSLLWKWSGMASLAAFAAIGMGPIIATINAVSIAKKKNLSNYHLWTYRVSIAYVGIVLLLLISSLIYY